MLKVRAPAMPADEVLRCVARGERPFLLDGASDADQLGRYTFAGCDPDDGLVWRTSDAGDPFALIADAQRRWTTGPVDDAWPIAVGFVTYDAAAQALARAHGRPWSAKDDLALPGVDFARYRAVWRFDRARGEAEVLAHDSASAQQLLDRLQRPPIPLHPPSAGALAPLWTRAEYEQRVARVLEYLAAGDAYQVNLAQRLVARCDEDGALALYLALRSGSPAPLGVYLRSAAGTLLSNTPERLLRVETVQRDGTWITRVETRPIKGTRPRGASPDEDRALAAALSSSDKDAAEHLMIVDLLRNDLGRIAKLGTVVVDGPRRLELPTVHHLVSTVEASLLGAGTAEILAAVLPGGSVTGAPKLRAVEIIRELEDQARGVYCGAIGWLGAGRALDFALPIRTALVRGGELVLPVGGGIVMDSTPAGEWAETMDKARAFARALSST